MTAGFQAAQCQCGHLDGDHVGHRRSLAGFMHGSYSAGRCLIPTCDCQAFVEAEQEESESRAAA